MNLFDAIFANDPSALAIRYGQRELTYGELRRETLRMAQAIVSLGAVPGDRVALLLHDSPEFIEAFIATCSLGAIAVPINTSLRADDQCSILHNSEAKLAFIEGDMCRELLTHAPEKLHSLENAVHLGGRSKQRHKGAPATKFVNDLEVRQPESITTPLTSAGIGFRTFSGPTAACATQDPPAQATLPASDSRTACVMRG